MNPELHLNDQFDPHQQRHLRTIITVGLLLVLAAIVTGYIYYGIRLASQGDEPVAEVEPVPVENDRRQAILQALETAPEASSESRAVIIENLTDTPTVDPERRAAVLEALSVE